MQWMVIAAGHILNVSERKIDGGVVIPQSLSVDEIGTPFTLLNSAKDLA